MKTRECAPREALRRLSAACKFLEAAELYVGDEDPAGQRVAVSNAVLAGIAATDAICCARLGRHAVGDDHRAAVDLGGTIGPEEREAAKALTVLLSIKHKAQCQTSAVAKADATRAVRRAQSLIAAAERLVLSST
ncbi:MAG: hypothetical protein ABIJ48_00980 [Actinomycetota bacterium]